MATGVVDGKEFISKMEDFFSDEQIIFNYKYGLNDFTQVEKFNISSQRPLERANYLLIENLFCNDHPAGSGVTNI